MRFWFSGALGAVIACCLLLPVRAAVADEAHCALDILVVDEELVPLSNTAVVVRTADGEMVKAVLTGEGTHFVDGVGLKTVLEIAHPLYGEVRFETVLPTEDPVLLVTVRMGTNPPILRFELPGGGLAGPGNPACPGNGDCFIAGGNGDVGCDDEECCNIVCALDPFCCDVAWDGICAQEANDNCPNVPLRACCIPGPPPTCMDLTAIDCANAGGTSFIGLLCADFDCPTPTNDLCEDAIPVAVPSSTIGTTLLAGIDLDGEVCGTLINSPGVWYSVIGTGTQLQATTCGAFFDYDTKISVFCRGCDGLACVGGNDDDCVGGASGLLSTVDWCSQAGAEYLILVHGFGGLSGEFVLDVFAHGGPCVPEVLCIPLGACCLPSGQCVDDISEADCAAQDGTEWTEGTQCEGGLLGYTIEDCGSAFLDISGTGIEAPTASNVDDGGDVVPLGFDFGFYGVTHATIGISSNGYLTFGPGLSDFSNDPIPNSTDPNDLIAPYWDDWSPNQGGTVHYQTMGAPGAQMFIAQWTDVPHFQGSGPSTFQAVLYEGTNCIEYRYGPLSLNTPTVGVENPDGTEGESVPGDSVADGDCLLICPELGAPLVCEAAGERAHPGWNWVDNGITLTMDEPTWWSSLTGQPKGVVPFQVLDPGLPPGRPAMDGTNERVLRGYVLAWAVDSEGRQIRWNHLKGEGTIVNYDRDFAWEYNAYTYAVNQGAANHGDPVGTAGAIKMDGVEYAANFGELLFNFQAAGAAAWGTPPGVVPAHTVVTDTDLTLHPMGADLRQTNDGPITTKASILIWNENEFQFSGTHRCITCWDQTLLSQYADPPNSFLRMFLQTDHGKARIDGHAAPDQCDDDDVTSIAAPLLGVHARLLAIDGANPTWSAASGGNLVGLGEDDTATILYDVVGAPGEAGWPGPDAPKAAQLAWLEREVGKKLRSDVTDPAEAAAAGAPTLPRVSANDKGSLLVFPKVELRWDAAGNLLQDTIISLTNDFPEGVQVQLYFINGDPPLDATGP